MKVGRKVRKEGKRKRKPNEKRWKGERQEEGLKREDNINYTCIAGMPGKEVSVEEKEQGRFSKSNML